MRPSKSVPARTSGSRVLANGEGEITGHDLQHAQFVTGADLLIHDAQYTADQYPAKVGWGHSTVEYAVKLSHKAQVKRLALTHHDPSRDDDALDRLLVSTKAKLRKNAFPLEVFAAREGHASTSRALTTSIRRVASKEIFRLRHSSTMP